MKKELREKLNTIINNNRKWPLLLEGVSAVNFPNAIVIPAYIPSSELGVIPSETGLKYPSWVMQMMIKTKKSDRILLVIDGMDRIIKSEQEKFHAILKFHRINGYKFPDGTQIIIPISKGGMDKVTESIKSLVMPYKVEE